MESCNCHGSHKGGRGPSSYWMHDPDLIFEELGLREGDSFLDLGCGPGDYTVQASSIVGDTGIILALDGSPEMIAALSGKVDSQKIDNIRASVSDLTDPLPVGDNCVDVCLIATVLHVPGVAEEGPALFSEIYRVLKPGGCLAVIECKKEETRFGPPVSMRLSPGEVERLATPCGFKKLGLTDLGNNYMIRFTA